MQAHLTFSFPFSISAHDAINAVAAHFGATVSINGAPAQVPNHIKAAVEAIGTEMNPAIAFGGLMNGGQAGNVNDAGYIAAVGTLASAPAAPLATSIPTAPLAPAPWAVAVAGAPTQPGNVATAPVGVEFDSSGLAWDARIHSGGKSKTPKGEWRALKGVDKNLVKTVEMELRAKYQNGTTASDTSPVASVDPATKKIQALAYAHNEALRVAGPQMIDDTTLAHLCDGKPATLSPEQNEWFRVYFAKRGAAYTEFMGNAASGAPAANAPSTPTGNAAAAQPASPLMPDASHVAAGGTPVPAPTAPQDGLDVTGLPHDSRIHVAAKLKDPQGVWLQRFDVTPEIKVAVMAELRAALTGNVAAAPSGMPAAPVGGSPVAPIPPVAPVVITAVEAGADFAKLMQWIVANQMAGRIGASAGPDAAKQLGFADAQGNGQLAMMAQQVAYLPYVVQILQSQGAF